MIVGNLCAMVSCICTAVGFYRCIVKSIYLQKRGIPKSERQKEIWNYVAMWRMYAFAGLFFVLSCLAKIYIRA